MKYPSIENLIKHNKAVMSSCGNSMLCNSLGEKYYICRGWVEALNYITNNYKLEEK